MSQVKVTWKAFGDKPEIGRFVSSVEFETEFAVEDANKFCEVIFHATNTYSGNLWQIIQPLLSETRTHTSISIGDEIEINGQVYICADFGFEKIEDVEIRNFPDGTIWSVMNKEAVAK
jgi:hypothetical protein